MSARISSAPFRRFRVPIAVLLLSWPVAATAQHRHSWDAIRSTLERQDVEVDVAFSDGRNDILTLSMEKTDTFESGPLSLSWDRRQVADVRLLRIEDGVYIVLSVEGTRELKAPVGFWHVDGTGVPGLHEGQWRIGSHDEVRGFNAMLGVGDRILGDVHLAAQW